MTATAWQDSFTEGYNMVKMLADIKKAGDAWKPTAAEVPAVLVTQETVGEFLSQHPEALQ